MLVSRTITMPIEYFNAIDKKIKKGEYEGISQFIQEAIKEKLEINSE
ncbi:ribbon-helix-helix domain-containing protein [Methanobacterium oryzae]